MPKRPLPTTCPCGGAAYASCCAPLLDGAAQAASAAILMRSRYTAYVRGNEAYLRATWHASTCPPEPLCDKDVQWLGLEVESALRLRQRKSNQSETDTEQTDSVEFVARYKSNGRAHRLHEVSRFVRQDGPDGGRWLYLDGSFPP